MAVERWTDEILDKLADSVKQLREDSQETLESIKQLKGARNALLPTIH